jgi:hypothetical protein
MASRSRCETQWRLHRGTHKNERVGCRNLRWTSFQVTSITMMKIELSHYEDSISVHKLKKKLLYYESYLNKCHSFSYLYDFCQFSLIINIINWIHLIILKLRQTQLIAYYKVVVNSFLRLRPEDTEIMNITSSLTISGVFGSNTLFSSFPIDNGSHETHKLSP